MKDAKTFRDEVIARLREVKAIDRSKHFNEKELELIDKVYSSALQIVELEIDIE